MTSSFVAADPLSSIQLLIAASETIMGAARILWKEETYGELKSFYASVKALCFIVNSHSKHVSEVVNGIEAEIIHETLDHLESAIAPEVLDSPLYKAFTRAPRYEKLSAFNRRWERIQKLSDNDKALRYVRSCMKFGTSAEERKQFIQLLDGCEEKLRVRYPENQSDMAHKELSTNAVGSASIAVWSAAQSIFNAFVASSKCECIPAHDIRVRLRLGTYRKHTLCIEEGMDNCLDFDMFLFMKQGWKETRVFMVKEITESIVRIQPNNPTKQPGGQKKATKIRQMRLKQLCEPIEKLNPAAHRLKLKVAGGQIFKLQSERSTFLVDRAKNPVTLEQFLRNGSQPFTERTKRILTVMLSYAVLYLHDTPWLRPTWSSSHVLFLPTTSSSVPLQPFIQTHLASHYKSNQISCIDPDELDPDDLVHHCPLLVTLAVMLMELYFAMPFDILAKQYGLDPAGDTQSSIFTLRYLDVSLVFEACKGEIPEGYQFHYVVEKCLDTSIWEDEDGNKLDNQTLMLKIYQEVVKPLETELRQAYSSISSDNLDEFAKTIDVANWDQSIQQHARDETLEGHTQDVKQTRHRKRPRSMSPDYSPRSSTGKFSGQYSEKCQHGCPDCATRSLRDASRATTIDDEGRASRFFDDETISEAHTNESRSNYHLWKSRYLDVYNKFIPQSSILPNVKIAILDTGVDIQHPYIDARSKNIKDRYNWLSEDEPVNVRVATDMSGHGTFAASLILDYAPDAQLFVAKIAEKAPSKASVIAKAINYAVSTWEVDVISMSFGFPTCNMDDYHELEDALANAHAKHVLLFAAASNSGGKLGRAYPARDQNAIAIHSTDTFGNRSVFSPTALSHDINLATVGEAIESAWPVYLSDNSNARALRCKSGTSFATAIAAGIAAFLLLYAKIHLPDKADALKSRRRMQALLKRVAEKEVGQTARDGYHFVDLSLYSDSLFGKSKEFIDETIRDVLNT